MLTLTSAAKVNAQTVNKDATPSQPNDAAIASRDKSIPADHYDPDDLKTYADVVVEDRDVVVRGKQLTVHFYRPRAEGAAIPAIYACGDGGWRGLAPRTAQQLAHIGFAVAGIDSKVYLREFSSLKSPLTIEKLASDYADIARALRPYATVDPGTPIFVYGWSLGAGFAIAVGSDAATRGNWAGIISIGLPNQNQLVSGVAGNYANLSIETNSVLGFRSADVIAAISPLPLLMIQSTSDTASPPKVGNALFAIARDPKQYVLIKASNHRFSGAREEFYSALANAVPQMREAANGTKSTQTVVVKSKS
jgi:dienelactone hydrolase